MFMVNPDRVFFFLAADDDSPSVAVLVGFSSPGFHMVCGFEWQIDGKESANRFVTEETAVHPHGRFWLGVDVDV